MILYLSLIIPRHGEFGTYCCKAFYHFYRSVDQRGQFWQFIFIKAIQHIINLAAFGEVIADTKAQARVFVIS